MVKGKFHPLDNFGLNENMKMKEIESSRQIINKMKQICKCGYTKPEHEHQHLLAVDRIEARKYGAPCGLFIKEVKK